MLAGRHAIGHFADVFNGHDADGAKQRRDHEASKLFKLGFHRGESFYNFQGLRGFKDKFGPEWEPLCIAVPSTWSLPAALLDATTLIGGGLCATLAKPRLNPPAGSPG